MQVHRISYKIKGFVRLSDYAIRWRHMISDKAKHKAKVISFWHKYGTEATELAFDVKERTLYYWQAKLKKSGGNLEALNNKSTKPKNTRIRSWPQEVINKIKTIREEHPNLGKDKVYIELKDYCKDYNLILPKPATIGNIIKDLGGLRKRPIKIRHNGKIVLKKRVKVIRKPKNFKASFPGHCGSFDTIEKIVHGSRRYVITFTDVYSRFSLAWATNSHASTAAKEFFDLTTFLFPYPLQNVLTDNGSEFKKYFDQELRRLHKLHWHTYPKTPKMNAHCERFNRSLQEEYIDYHEYELLDTNVFNKGLMKHLLWHNTKRPHWSLKLKSPVQYIVDNYPQDCNMYLTNTDI